MKTEFKIALALYGLLAYSTVGYAQLQPSFREWGLPTTLTLPFRIAAGPDGALWFTSPGLANDHIGRITTAGVIASYSGVSGSIPWGIVSGPDDAVWLTGIGGSDIFRINDLIDGRNACYVAYVRSTNSIYLVDDAGHSAGPFAGGMTLNGANAAIENNQCRIDGVGSSAAGSGNTLTLTLSVLFKGGFRGNRVVYSAARDNADGNNTGWQAVGTWSVQ